MTELEPRSRNALPHRGNRSRPVVCASCSMNGGPLGMSCLGWVEHLCTFSPLNRPLDSATGRAFFPLNTVLSRLSPPYDSTLFWICRILRRQAVLTPRRSKVLFLELCRLHCRITRHTYLPNPGMLWHWTREPYPFLTQRGHVVTCAGRK